MSTGGPGSVPVTADEAEQRRLQALRRYRVLDTPPEPGFDDITTLAARLFDVPVVLISLVDADRQWFKARLGVDVAQTGPELSFCRLAIRTPDRVRVRCA